MDTEHTHTIRIENPTPELLRFFRRWRIQQYKNIKRLREKYKYEISGNKLSDK